MPRLLPLVVLLPLLAAVVLAQPPTPPPLTDAQKEMLNEAGKYLRESKELEQAGKLKEAAAAAEKMLKVEREVYGKVYPEVADSLKMVGRLHRRAENWPAARTVLAEHLELRLALHGKDHWRVTEARVAVADVDTFEKLTDEQRTAVRKAEEADAGGDRFLRAGQYPQAEPLYKEALAGRRKALGESHPDTLQSLSKLADLYRVQGRYADAELLFKQALAGSKKTLGESHPSTLASLYNLASLYQAQGKYADAEPLLKDALTGCKKTLGESHPFTLQSLSDLASLYHDQGRDADAELLFKQALAGRRKALGGSHLDTLNSLNNLASLYHDQSRYADAEPLLKDALAGRRKALGESHPFTLTSLNNLASLYKAQGKYADAEPLYMEALAGRRKALGESHPSTLNSLNNLASLYYAQSRYADAEPLLKDALAGFRKALGESHPSTLNSLYNLASLYYAQSRYADAEPLYKQALVGTRTFIDATAVGQAEGQQLTFRNTLRYRFDAFLAFSLAAKTLAAERYVEVLAWKGGAFARQSQLRAAVAASGDAALTKRFAESSEVARQLATLTSATPPADRLAAYRKQLKELAERKDELDQELARKSEPFRKARETAAVTPEQLTKALPADAALVDFLEYRHPTRDPDRKGGWQQERRYLAFIVRNGKPVVEVELKASAPINEAVTAWRQAIERGVGNGEPAALLRKLVWEPLAKHLGDAKTVLISPDGALGRLPFAALPGSDPKKYLIEEIAVAVVPVPQLIPELLSAKPVGDAKPSLLVVGGVDFDADAGTPTAGTDARAAVRAGSAGKWGALAGTSDEAKAVANAFAKQFPDDKTTLLTGTGATEAGVRAGITGRRMLHFATHGFFAPPPPEPKEPVGLRAEMFDRNRAVGVHPGLQCGLVLAGANKPPKAGADDGILTALEVAGLDLRGVDLAVLSACETGLGKEAGGEGVLGLQRAFQAAGARAVVSSLWKVPDQATAALMGRFYQHLWADKQPAAEALRRAQLELLRNPDKVAGWAKAFRGATADDDKVEVTDGRLPPRAWAAFTLSGDWR